MNPLKLNWYCRCWYLFPWICSIVSVVGYAWTVVLETHWFGKLVIGSALGVENRDTFSPITRRWVILYLDLPACIADPGCWSLGLLNARSLETTPLWCDHLSSRNSLTVCYYHSFCEAIKNDKISNFLWLLITYLCFHAITRGETFVRTFAIAANIHIQIPQNSEGRCAWNCGSIGNNCTVGW